jgi:hypothetical protein
VSQWAKIFDKTLFPSKFSLFFTSNSQIWAKIYAKFKKIESQKVKKNQIGIVKLIQKNIGK